MFNILVESGCIPSFLRNVIQSYMILCFLILVFPTLIITYKKNERE